MTVSDLADSGRTLRHELINGNLYPLTLSGLHQIICRKLADAWSRNGTTGRTSCRCATCRWRSTDTTHPARTS